MTDVSLTAHVVKLATLREEAAQRAANIKAKRDAFEATIADEVALLTASKAAVEATESDVRALSLSAHSQSGTRKPTNGVEIVLTKKYEVDEAAAYEWAKASNMCLIPEKVDIKAVQKIATVQSLHFVTVTEEPSVRIATDLAKALGDVTQAAA